MPGSTGQFRALATNTTVASLTLTSGRYQVTALPAANRVVIDLGSASESGPGPVRYRGVHIQMFGAGADNDTVTLRVFRVERSRATRFRTATAEPQPNEADVTLVGTLTCTLSTAVGIVGSSIVSGSERLADTYSWTAATQLSSPAGIGTFLSDAYAAPSATLFSPANNTPGRIYLPDLGSGDLLLEIARGSATNANALIGLDV